MPLGKMPLCEAEERLCRELDGGYVVFAELPLWNDVGILPVTIDDPSEGERTVLVAYDAFRRGFGRLADRDAAETAAECARRRFPEAKAVSVAAPKDGRICLDVPGHGPLRVCELYSGTGPGIPDLAIRDLTPLWAPDRIASNAEVRLAASLRRAVKRAGPSARARIDEELEGMWAELADVPFEEDGRGEPMLESDWGHFPSGTPREDIWRWFDRRHSQGVHALMFPDEHPARDLSDEDPGRGDLSAAFEEYRLKTGWQGLSGAEAVETFVRFCESGKSEAYRQPGPGAGARSRDAELLAQYQAAMVGLCRELGLEPSTSVADPYYYADMASEAIGELQARQGALDPKGHVVLCDFGDAALVLTSTSAPEPFVVAHGYDPDTGEWARGEYFSDLSWAWDEANPSIISDATVKWTREDLADALVRAGLPETDRNADELLEAAGGLVGWRDAATRRGNEFLDEAAADVKRLHERNVAVEPAPRHTVASAAAQARAQAAQRAKAARPAPAQRHKR